MPHNQAKVCPQVDKAPEPETASTTDSTVLALERGWCQLPYDPAWNADER